MISDKLIPLTMYIHYPWCVRKCPYCDFNSFPRSSAQIEEQYLQALCSDLENDIQHTHKRSLHSIFIGGGTPSLLSPANIEQILNRVAAKIKFEPDIEITLEANPGTLNANKLRAFLNSGINRLSIGVQSFQDKQLKLLERIHTSKQACENVELAKAAGFSNINIDLMFGIPEQTVSTALDDLTTAIKLNPTHISWYQLTIESNTAFASNPPALPNEDLIWEIQQQGQQLLAKNGFVQYEISAYAKPEFQCQHNLNYWLFGDYLGIGAGAHAKITNPENEEIIRTQKIHDPNMYINSDNNYIEKCFRLSHDELIAEFMLNSLRLYQPISLDLFSQRTGLNYSAIKSQLEEAQQLGLLIIKDNCIQTTATGKKYLNNLLELFA